MRRTFKSPISLDFPVTITAVNVCSSLDQDLPLVFSLHKTGMISIKDFEEAFHTTRFHPILIAESITTQEFIQKIESSPNYGRLFSYDVQNNGNPKYYISDLRTWERSAYVESFGGGFSEASNREFGDLNPFVFSHCSLLGPDLSIGISSGYFDPKGLDLSLLVLEVAWCQTTESLENKVSRWKALGVPCIVAIDRNVQNGQLRILMVDSSSELPVLDVCTLADAQNVNVAFGVKRSAFVKVPRLADHLKDCSIDEFTVCVSFKKL